MIRKIYIGTKSNWHKPTQYYASLDLLSLSYLVNWDITKTHSGITNRKTALNFTLTILNIDFIIIIHLRTPK